MTPQHIAFYAPLKSPNHPVPSGDRAMARGVIAALQGMKSNPQVDLVSELRSWEGRGDAQAQLALIAAADMEISLLLRRAKTAGWQVWVTYHNYYKAPDLIGPAVAAELNIPYVLIEASRSSKRLLGPWAMFAQRAEEACDAAASIFYMTQRDHPALVAGQFKAQSLVHLPPFLNQTTLPELTVSRDAGVLLSVGMFREGDKTASYRLLAEALHQTKSDWQLRIIGAGKAEQTIHDMFQPFANRVSFLGQLNAAQVAGEMSHADVFVWPGVNEAFGMVYLEAQAHGLPVVAQDRPGVRDVIGSGGALAPIGNTAQFAANIDRLLMEKDARKLAQTRARAYIRDTHLLPAASQQFEMELKRLLGKKHG